MQGVGFRVEGFRALGFRVFVGLRSLNLESRGQGVELGFQGFNMKRYSRGSCSLLEAPPIGYPFVRRAD